jgi:hypothetical protein
MLVDPSSVLVRGHSLSSDSWKPGLPDGLFSNQKSNLGKFGMALYWKMLIHIFYGHFEYFTDIWDILRPFGTICVHLVHFFRFWYHASRKIWQPRWKPTAIIDNQQFSAASSMNTNSVILQALQANMCKMFAFEY